MSPAAHAIRALSPLERLGWREAAFRALDLTCRTPALVLFELMTADGEWVSADTLMARCGHRGQAVSGNYLRVGLWHLRGALADLGFEGAVTCERPGRYRLDARCIAEIDALVRGFA
ncbi:MAG: hypothetical protein WDM92_16675 [Caulobacteraceae bacterium]